MLKYLLLIFFSISFNLNSQKLSNTDSIAIVKVMDLQKDSWNNNDINEFMNGYLNYEKLVFSGKNGRRVA